MSPGASSASLAPSRARGSGGQHRVHAPQLLRLLVHCIDDALVTMSDVHGHQLAVEVEEPPAVGRACSSPGVLIGSGSTAPCADHSKIVCFFERSTMSWAERGEVAVGADMMEGTVSPDQSGCQSAEATVLRGVAAAGRARPTELFEPPSPCDRC